MRAIYWGFGTAILHRIALTIWLALVWSLLSANFAGVQVDFHTAGAQLPALTTQSDELIFGVWRRWDAVHYLDLAANGYRVDHPGPTVFGVLTPLGIRAFDALLPGSLDLGALVFETLAFGLALTLLYKVVEDYYGGKPDLTPRRPLPSVEAGSPSSEIEGETTRVDTHGDRKDTRTSLARWAVVVTALLPLSYFFAAPMSESIYLAMTLGFFYFGVKRRWFWAAICGALATLARSQGVLLFPVAGLLLLEQNGFRLERRDQWIDQERRAIRQGWSLLLIPLAFFGFEAYRAAIGLPSISEIYTNISFNYFTNPIDGLITNLRWFVERPAEAFTTLDLMALLIALILAFVALRFPRHRRLPLIGYTFSFILLFVSRINYYYGTHDVMFTQSFGRYTLTLFPLTVLVADGIRSTTPLIRVIVMALLLLGFFSFSAFYLLALTGP